MKIYQVYERSPIFFQNIVCSLYGFKEYRKRFNGGFRDNLRNLKFSESFSKEEVFLYKRDRLSAVLIHAKNHMYLSSRLKDFSADEIYDNPFEVLKSLPVLSKAELVELDMSGFLDANSKIYKTSGTTGKALSLCKDDESIEMQWAVWMRHRNRFGVNLGDLSVNFTGKPIVPEWQTEPPYWRFNRAQNQYLISSKHINLRNIDSIVNFLNSISPVFYSGYPSIISELSRLALSKDLKLNKNNTPCVIFSGAENLLEYQESTINAWIDSIITDQYGLTEGNCNFSKCEYGYYHEDFEFCHIELLDAKTEPDGRIQGNLVGTAFYNKSFPLIRYDTGDIATFAPSNFECKCGRKSQVILSVEGRKDDYIITPDGRRVMRFGYLFRDTFEATEVQLVQEKPKEITFKTVLSGRGLIKDFEDKVTVLFRQYISTEMVLNFDYVESIERSSNGKFKAVLNRMV